MPDILSQICSDKYLHIEARKKTAPLAHLETEISQQSPPRGFTQKLVSDAQENGFSLICEIKKASPSQGVIRQDFSPSSLAKAYADGGASCLSVLTDLPYFQGLDAYLPEVKKAVDLPVLRKDFMLDPYQIYESRALGADCVLLIMAALSHDQAKELESTALSLGMDVLIEVHDVEELEGALRLGSTLIGVNNRNLKTFEVDLGTSEDLSRLLPGNRFLVSESGIYKGADIARLVKAGAGAFLVGHSLMMQEDVRIATECLIADGKQHVSKWRKSA